LTSVADVLVLPAFGRQQNYAGSLLNPGLHAPALGQNSQRTFELRIQFNLVAVRIAPASMDLGVCK
jgi:hypothetical protein